MDSYMSEHKMATLNAVAWTASIQIATVKYLF